MTLNYEHTIHGGMMKTAYKFVACAIALFIVILGNSSVFAGVTPETSLEKSAVENAPPSSDGPVAVMPPMDFAPATSTENPVVSPPVMSAKRISDVKKHSNKIREYWLRIHADEMKSVNNSAAREQAPEVKSETDSAPAGNVAEIKENAPVEIKTVDAVPGSDVKHANDEKLGEATIKIEKPIPHSEAPVIVQTAHSDDKLNSPEPMTSDEKFNAAALPLFSDTLAKLNARRAYRETEARRLNIVLPSKGGSAEKVLPSMLKLNAAVSEIIERKSAKFDIKQIATNGLLASPESSGLFQDR